MTASRLDRLRMAMNERHLPAVIVGKPENRAYLSGFTGTAALLLITMERALLFTDFRYAVQASLQAPHFEVIQQTDSLQAAAAAACDTQGVPIVGFEGDYLTVDDYLENKRLHQARQLESVTGLVEGLRMIKDESELNAMRRAAAIADEAFTAILPLIRPGAVERDLAVELEYTMKKLGAEGLSFDMIVASGIRSSLPHGRASEKVIEAGDFVTLDFGCVYQGYCSDMTRTVVVGQPTEKQREIYGIVLEAQKRGVAACRAGMTGKDLDEVCRRYIREHGYGDAFGHGTGHGVGRYIHEGPRVSVRGEHEVLEPDMIVTIEPGIYLPNWGGVRIEDMLLVQADGCESFTKSPKDLLIL